MAWLAAQSEAVMRDPLRHALHMDTCVAANTADEGQALSGQQGPHTLLTRMPCLYPRSLACSCRRTALVLEISCLVRWWAWELECFVLTTCSIATSDWRSGHRER